MVEEQSLQKHVEQGHRWTVDRRPDRKDRPGQGLAALQLMRVHLKKGEYKTGGYFKDPEQLGLFYKQRHDHDINLLRIFLQHL